MIDQIVNKLYSNAKEGITTTLMGVFMVLSGFSLYCVYLFSDTPKIIDMQYVGYWMLGGVVLIITKFDKQKSKSDVE